jgi:2-polyprenyl-3-methyl-5-hydroxy-6-metoxy-1,4-benzoquinol methylase
MLNLDIISTYDFIVMGEVIEHAENSVSLLVKISILLSNNGKAF